MSQAAPAPATHDAIRRIAARYPGLRFLLLFGSRARATASPMSDWDLAYVAGDGFDAEGLSAELCLALETDHVELVDLSRAGGLLRFRAARDGILLLEHEPDSHARFWLDAVGFWCDAAPVLASGYEAVLSRLDK